MRARAVVGAWVSAAALAAAAGVSAQEGGSAVEPVEALEAWDGLGGGLGPIAADGAETGEPAAGEADAAARAEPEDAETRELAGEDEDDAEPAAPAADGTETGSGPADDADATVAPPPVEDAAAEAGSGPAGAVDGGSAGAGATDSVVRPELRWPEAAAEPAAAAGSVPVLPPAGAGGEGAAAVLAVPAPSPPVAAAAAPRGSLWRLLDERAERAAGETAAAYVADMAREGCPRDLLGLLLGSATEAREALTAVGLEREILELCRRRQDAVAAVLEREAELREIVRELRGGAPAPVAGGPEDWAAAIEAVPQLGLPGDAGGAAAEEREEDQALPAEVAVAPAPAPVPAPPPAAPPPPYRWFTLAGSAGALRAGVTDGTGVWFVGEGDALPGETWVAEITADPPGVRVAGAAEAALPWGAPP